MARIAPLSAALVPLLALCGINCGDGPGDTACKPGERIELLTICAAHGGDFESTSSAAGLTECSFGGGGGGGGGSGMGACLVSGEGECRIACTLSSDGTGDSMDDIPESATAPGSADSTSAETTSVVSTADETETEGGADPNCVGCSYCAFSSIQDAISQAGYGDTILVCSGVYEESLSVFQSLTIEGLAGATILCPDATCISVVLDSPVDQFTVRGLTIAGGDQGISFNPMGALRVEDSLITEHSASGISMSGGGFPAIEIVDAVISFNGPAGHGALSLNLFSGHLELAIDGTQIHGNSGLSGAIGLGGASATANVEIVDSAITMNQASGVGYTGGIDVEPSGELTLDKVDLIGNIAPNFSAISLKGATVATASECRFESNVGTSDAVESTIAAVQVSPGAIFESDSSEWGSGIHENIHWDVRSGKYAGSAMVLDYDGVASFTCVGEENTCSSP